MAYPENTNNIVFVKCSFGSINLNIVNHPSNTGESSLADSKLTRVVGAVSSMISLKVTVNSAVLSANHSWETWKTTDQDHLGVSSTSFVAPCVALVFGV